MSLARLFFVFLHLQVLFKMVYQSFRVLTEKTGSATAGRYDDAAVFMKGGESSGVGNGD
jgi:hypothetical protein